MKKENDKKNKKNRSFESNFDPLSPSDKKVENSPKRSRKENKSNISTSDPNKEKSPNKMEVMNLENVASQVTVENSPHQKC